MRKINHVGNRIRIRICAQTLIIYWRFITKFQNFEIKNFFFFVGSVTANYKLAVRAYNQVIICIANGLVVKLISPHIQST